MSKLVRNWLSQFAIAHKTHCIESYLDATDQARVQPNALRIDGKFSESIDWNHVKQRFARYVLLANMSFNQHFSARPRPFQARNGNKALTSPGNTTPGALLVCERPEL